MILISKADVRTVAALGAGSRERRRVVVIQNRIYSFAESRLETSCVLVAGGAISAAGHGLAYIHKQMAALVEIRFDEFYFQLCLSGRRKRTVENQHCIIYRLIVGVRECSMAHLFQTDFHIRKITFVAFFFHEERQVGNFLSFHVYQISGRIDNLRTIVLVCPSYVHRSILHTGVIDTDFENLRLHGYASNQCGSKKSKEFSHTFK